MRWRALAAMVVVGAGACLAQVRPTPMPDVSGSNLPAQPIAANDLIAVSVYDAPELTRTVRVGADGVIRLPMLKQRLKVGGLLPNEVEAAITEALKSEELLVDPVVTVTVVEYHSRPISVAGAVKKPVTFEAIGPTTLLEALAKAEGLTAEAGPEILLSRKGADGAAPEVRRIPVPALIDRAEPELNVQLAGGDEIRVPEAAKIYVIGNVKKPGAFPVRDGTENSVLKLLALAEGVMPYASKQAYILRGEPGTATRREIAVELAKILDRKAPDVLLEPNDLLYVPDNRRRRVTATVIDRITGFGASTASGVLIWRR